jgi:hypothetical protein
MLTGNTAQGGCNSESKEAPSPTGARFSRLERQDWVQSGASHIHLLLRPENRAQPGADRGIMRGRPMNQRTPQDRRLVVMVSPLYFLKNYSTTGNL